MSVAVEESAAGNSTEFRFQHKVFQMPGGVFSRTANDEIAFHFELGDLTAALTITVLTHEFSIADNSPDGQLLRTVTAGLRYVREIRPNDSIPRELLDGTASWTVEERHRRRARNRLVLCVIGAATAGGGKGIAFPENDRIDALAAAAEQGPGWNQALVRLAAALELDREQAVQRIAAIGRELAYIEALRERCRLIGDLSTTLVQVGQIYRRDETLFQAVLRTITLLKRPTREHAELFQQLDAQTARIEDLLRRYHVQISFIRQVRDEVHERTMPWGGLPQAWHELEITRGETLEHQVKELYRFVAHHFPQTVDWRPKK